MFEISTDGYFQAQQYQYPRSGVSGSMVRYTSHQHPTEKTRRIEELLTGLFGWSINEGRAAPESSASDEVSGLYDFSSNRTKRAPRTLMPCYGIYR